MWRLPWLTKGVAHWWCLGDVAFALHTELDGMAVVRYVLNSWSRWTEYSTPFAPADLCLLKGIDRAGRTKRWNRVLVEHACSTTGLLCILLGQVAFCRKPDPLAASAFLHAFLEDRLGSTEVDLCVPLDKAVATAYCHAGLQPPLALCATLPLDGTALHLQPWLDQSEGNAHAHLREQVAALTEAGLVVDGHVHVGDMLESLRQTPALLWLCRALLHQVARLVDACWKGADFHENPVEAERSWGGRASLDLSLHVDTCQGGLEASNEGATFPQQFVENFHKLRKKHTGQRQAKMPLVSFNRASCQVLVRYQAASKHFRSEC